MAKKKSTAKKKGTSEAVTSKRLSNGTSLREDLLSLIEDINLIDVLENPIEVKDNDSIEDLKERIRSHSEDLLDSDPLTSKSKETLNKIGIQLSTELEKSESEESESEELEEPEPKKATRPRKGIKSTRPAAVGLALKKVGKKGLNRKDLVDLVDSIYMEIGGISNHRESRVQTEKVLAALVMLDIVEIKEDIVYYCPPLKVKK